MKTYFARHSGDLDVDDDTLQRLRLAKKVAIHYPWTRDSTDESTDTESLDPDSYARGGKSALGAMIECARDGGYVCATYRNTRSAFVGSVQAGTKIELIETHWGSDPSRRAVLKAMSLQDMVEVPPAKQSLFLSMAPQKSTFCRWHSVGDKIERLILGLPLAEDLGSLHSAYQEIMCSEFLRMHDIESLPRLRYLLLPVGRTMKGLDILGLAEDGKQLLAQVTYGDSSAKLNELAAYGDVASNHLVYFCDATDVHRRGEVVVIPLQLVFEQFGATTSGKQWLESVHRLL